MESSGDDYVIIRREFRVLNPRPEESILVSLNEWESLTRQVEACKIPVRPRIILQCVAFALGLIGVALTAAAYLAQLPDWVFSIGISLCVFGLAAGFTSGLSGAAMAKDQLVAIGRFAAELTHLRRKAMLYPSPQHPEPEATRP